MAFNVIEQLGRALFAQLAPLTGTRATGTVTVTAPADAEIEPNTYLLPVVGGQLRDDLLFKVTVNPATGLVWPLPAGVPTPIGITSNVGGARHNLAAGTAFRFSPALPDVAAPATLVADLTDGSDTGALVKRVAFFEDLDSSNPSKDIFAAKLGDYPALMLVWQDSEPAEGTQAGLRQGANRGSRKVRFMRERFVLYVITGRLEGDGSRRQDGLVVMQAVTLLLTDRQRNVDGEQLSTVGAGVEVNERTRLRRGERHYIYALRLRTNQTLQPVDERTFSAWVTTSLEGALPGRSAPEPVVPLTIVAVDEAMP
jgi:hypothetical protein